MKIFNFFKIIFLKFYFPHLIIIVICFISNFMAYNHIFQSIITIMESINFTNYHYQAFFSQIYKFNYNFLILIMYYITYFKIFDVFYFIINIFTKFNPH